MENQNIKFSKILTKMKSTDFIYLYVAFIFFIIVFILFLNSTNFIITNVNKIFSPTNDGNTQALNMENYSLVEKRLNLPVNSISENTTQNTPVVEPIPVVDNTVTTPVIVPVTPVVENIPTPAPTPVLDKKSITINILNTTSEKGVAATLAKAMETAGFSTATTGNDKKVYALTTILIKDSKKDYTSLVEEIVKASYPKAVTDINPETSSFDVVIMIGKE